MIAGNALARALVPVLRALQSLCIPHYAGGSVASSIQGAVRATIDVDLVVEMRADQSDGLVAQLTPDFYASREMIRAAVSERSCFNVIHLETMTKIDVYIAGNRPYDAGVWLRLDSFPLPFGADLVLPLLSPEDVILTKLEWFVAGGSVSERQLGDVKGVLRARRDSLDWAYLDRWSSELGVEPVLSMLRAQVDG